MINDPISIFKELGLSPHVPLEDFYKTILKRHREGSLTSEEIERIECFAGKDIFNYLENEWSEGKKARNLPTELATAV